MRFVAARRAGLTTTTIRHPAASHRVTFASTSAYVASRIPEIAYDVTKGGIRPSEDLELEGMDLPEMALRFTADLGRVAPD